MIEYRNAKDTEADEVAELEQICFPPNEACSVAHMKERMAAAGEMFLVAVDQRAGRLAGVLNGIATDEKKFRDVFFTNASLHQSKGECVMILGLAVRPEYRGKGVARELMRRFLERERMRGRKRVILTCLEDKVAMYRKMGFEDLGMADSEWGGEKWHEMCVDL